MAALSQGSQAPDFTLLDADGDEFHLHTALASGPVLLTFFKTSCPTCQYTLPYLNRFEASLDGAVAVAVAQDTPADADRFNVAYGCTTRQLFDLQETGFEVSNAYGLTNVPAVFLVGADGRIQHTMVGWSKVDVEELARKLKVSFPFKPGEDVLDYRPG